MTFNKRITEGIHNETIKTKTIDGVTVYLVERPRDKEVVVGYTNFASLFNHETATDRASREANTE